MIDAKSLFFLFVFSFSADSDLEPLSRLHMALVRRRPAPIKGLVIFSQLQLFSSVRPFFIVAARIKDQGPDFTQPCDNGGPPILGSCVDVKVALRELHSYSL